LVSFEDLHHKSHHDIPKLETLTDDNIVDLLLNRAKHDEREFTSLLTKIVEVLNTTPTIKEICHKFEIESRYYPLNMARFFDKDTLSNEKVSLKVGPIKTRERGIVKVKDEKDKTGALLDALRATILCRDPTVPIIIIEYLRKIGKLTRVKNKTHPSAPYKCVHINFALGEAGKRTIYELQIVLEEYYELQKKDHDYYEVLRVND